jgi:ATP-dependent exoDNAse (exonuclease V) beta subunit
MTTLNNIITAANQSEYATRHGTQMHARLQKITQSDIISPTDDIAKSISANSELRKIFLDTSLTEVPVAGTINGRFISRRIDRMHIDHQNKTIQILDYKTDTDPNIRRSAYIYQIREYIDLVRAIYPDYTVYGYILWTHDFSLERI